MEHDRMKLNDGNIIVYPEIHNPATTSDSSDNNMEFKKEMDIYNRNSALNKNNSQIKLGKVEARVFLRETKPKSHYAEELQRPQISSDSESRMLVVGEDPRLYYTDSECITSASNSKHFQKHKKPIHYAIPYYARVSKTPVFCLKIFY
ncbi:unnamed protein product [Onchocerca flexuosa]|uniref:Uncharacterized protein n=1 Tax=Onchocerca flexuosa TaxID=387005 RepID=A0A183HVQ6_9BILA|nr:unnamed protein product [Onchocerca flexuosa]